jgi:hypothetical protein
MIQADTGSQKQNRRSWSWIREFERTSAGMGAANTTIYEYPIGDARVDGNQVILTTSASRAAPR